MTDPHKPPGYPSVSPYLVVTDAGAVIDFLRAALGAEELRRFEGPDGGIVHAEVRVDDGVVMLGEAPEGSHATPCHVHVYVPDVDAAYEAALAAGGESVQAPVRKDDPDRRGGVRGPGGNTWWVSTMGSG